MCDFSGARRRRVGRGFDVPGPPRVDRLLQLVGVAADVLLLIDRCAANQLHPRRDDAVLATEKTVPDGLSITRGPRLGEIGLELLDETLDRLSARREGQEVVSHKSSVVSHKS